MRKLDPGSLIEHLDRLYRAAWALCGSREDAEDLVQETYARVLARPRVIRGNDDLAYLMQVLRNTFLTSRRTAGRRPNVVAVAEDFETADPRSANRPEEALAIGAVFGAIAELPESFGFALVAVDVVGLSYREAARALGTREATITTRLFRARQQVARALSAGEPQRPSARGAAGAVSTPAVSDASPASSTDPVGASSSGLSPPLAEPLRDDGLVNGRPAADHHREGTTPRRGLA